MVRLPDQGDNVELAGLTVASLHSILDAGDSMSRRAFEVDGGRLRIQLDRKGPSRTRILVRPLQEESHLHLAGGRTRVRHRQGLRGGFRIGADCVIARFVEIGDGVRIGDRCKVEASACPPPGVFLEDDASVPRACLTNDRRPRAGGTGSASARWRGGGRGSDGARCGGDQGREGVEAAAGSTAREAKGR